MMFEATVNEFPFVAALPKREKSKLATLWEQLEEWRALAEKEGFLIPVVGAANLLGVSRQRIEELMRDGRLRRVDLFNHVYVPESSVVEYAEAERRTGRPLGTPKTKRELLKMAVASGRGPYLKKS